LKGLCFQALVNADGGQAKAALDIAGDPTRLRTAELKLRDYYDHLRSVIEPFTTAEERLPIAGVVSRTFLTVTSSLWESWCGDIFTKINQ
jgi:hypothetical protein